MLRHHLQKCSKVGLKVSREHSFGEPHLGLYTWSIAALCEHCRYPLSKDIKVIFCVCISGISISKISAFHLDSTDTDLSSLNSSTEKHQRMDQDLRKLLKSRSFPKKTNVHTISHTIDLQFSEFQKFQNSKKNPRSCAVATAWARLLQPAGWSLQRPAGFLNIGRKEPPQN